MHQNVAVQKSLLALRAPFTSLHSTGRTSPVKDRTGFVSIGQLFMMPCCKVTRTTSGRLVRTSPRGRTIGRLCCCGGAWRGARRGACREPCQAGRLMFARLRMQVPCLRMPVAQHKTC